VVQEMLRRIEQTERVAGVSRTVHPINELSAEMISPQRLYMLTNIDRSALDGTFMWI